MYSLKTHVVAIGLMVMVIANAFGHPQIAGSAYMISFAFFILLNIL